MRVPTAKFDTGSPERGGLNRGVENGIGGGTNRCGTAALTGATRHPQRLQYTAPSGSNLEHWVQELIGDLSHAADLWASYAWQAPPATFIFADQCRLKY
jgi:hypothetical protein